MTISHDLSRWRRVNTCLDHAERPRELVLLVEHGVMSLHTPPGDVATFQPSEIGPLRQSIADAQAATLQQRGGF